MYSILGASGSGKSSVMEQLNDTRIQFYDFDAIGVPEHADTAWRQKATEQWLQKIIASGQQDSACLFGQMVLGEIIACPSFDNIMSTHVCFLECNDPVRIQRLKGRHEPPPISRYIKLGLMATYASLRLKMKASDGKKYRTDVATPETLLRLVHSIPSPKAEPIKLWLAKVGYERMQEMADP